MSGPTSEKIYITGIIRKILLDFPNHGKGAEGGNGGFNGPLNAGRARWQERTGGLWIHDGVGRRFQVDRPGG